MKHTVVRLPRGRRREISLESVWINSDSDALLMPPGLRSRGRWWRAAVLLLYLCHPHLFALFDLAEFVRDNLRGRPQLAVLATTCPLIQSLSQ